MDFIKFESTINNKINKDNSLIQFENSYDIEVDFVEIAKAFSKVAHAGMQDKAFQEYYKHPKAVEEIIEFKMKSEINLLDFSKKTKQETIDFLIVTAYLHDILEDTTYTAEDLLKKQIPFEVVNLVILMARSQDITYFDYIRKISNNKFATIVKLADLQHNLDITRFKDKNSISKSLLERY